MDRIRKMLKTLCTSVKEKEEKNVVSMLTMLTSKLPKHHGEIWRSERPTHTDDPMSIKRSETPWKRRVALHDIHAVFSETSKDENIDTQAYSSCQSSTTCSHDDLCSIASSKVSVHEEEESDQEQFVSSFGRKGKQVGRFEDAKDITCLPDDELLIADLVLGRLQKFTKTAKCIALFAPGESNTPWATTMTKDGNIAVTLFDDHCVKVFDKAEECVLKFGGNILHGPRGIACDSKGNFIVTDERQSTVFMFDKAGEFLRCLGDPEKVQERFLKPRYVCINSNNDIIVSDSGTHQVKIFYPNGEFRKAFGSFGKEDGHLKCPYGVCTNSASDIFVADHYNNRISMFTKHGQFIRHVITEGHGLFHPQGVAVDSKNYLFVSHGQFKATEILTFKLSQTSAESQDDADW